MKKEFEYSRRIHHMWVLLRQASNLMPKYVEPIFAKVGLTYQQYMVIFTIKLLDSPVTISDVANSLDRSVNTVSTIIERMHKDGLVKRVRDSRDRRTVILRVTREGEEKARSAALPYWNMVEKLLSHFSREELKTMESLIGKLKGYMAEELGVDKVSELYTEINPDKVERIWEGLVRGN